MKQGFAIVVTLAATPAFAHHEVVVVTSMVPVAMACAAIPLAAFAAWCRGRKK